MKNYLAIWMNLKKALKAFEEIDNKINEDDTLELLKEKYNVSTWEEWDIEITPDFQVESIYSEEYGLITINLTFENKLGITDVRILDLELPEDVLKEITINYLKKHLMDK